MLSPDPSPPRRRLVLASGSSVRREMLDRVGLSVEVMVPRIDEETIRTSLAGEGVSPRDTADALAELKARKVAMARPDALVLGADQVLDLGGRAIGKSGSPEAARALLAALSGRTHLLHSAAVLYEDAAPVWRHVATVRMTMRPLSDAFMDEYVARSWETTRSSVGGYLIEGEGARLFNRIEGSHFAILGLPLLELCSYFVLRGIMDA